MGRDLVEPDWPPLTDAEVGAVLARYGWTAGQAAVRWRSPRPMSAAALVDGDGQEVFVKRHHALVRTAAWPAVHPYRASTAPTSASVSGGQSGSTRSLPMP